ncbi:hypothetical protein PT974_12333 [Cladobotryum mycophilum]|uniref:Fucose-specific lectin n=1 Tax=Cladobotryum mycophilum TaxID=491253 RepID=A0ABR0S7P3_9HYPO
MGSQKLILMYYADSAPKEHRYADQAHALIADLDDTTELNKLLFSQDTQLTPPPDKASHMSYGSLLFDDQRNELVFVTHARINNVEGDNIIRVWKIGPYLSLTSVEDTPLRYGGYPQQLGSIIEANSTNFGTSIKRNKDGQDPFQHEIYRKGLDNKWISVPLRAMDYVEQGTTVTFVRCPQSSKYIHYVTCTRDYHGEIDPLHVYSIGSRNFSEIATNDSIAWQHYRVYPGFSTGCGFTTHVTFNASQDAGRLYFIAPLGMRNIAFSYINVRKDCSIKSNSSEIQCLGKTVVPIPQGATGLSPHVVEWNGRVIILVPGLSDSFSAIVGQIGADGSLPEAKDWRLIPVEFTSPVTKDALNFGGAAVVDSDFID